MEKLTSVQSNDTTKQSKELITIFGFIALCLLAIAFLPNLLKTNGKHATASMMNAQAKQLVQSLPITVPTLKYGFALDTFHVTVDTIADNQFLSEILLPHKVAYADIDQLARNVKDTFAVTKLRAFKPYTVLSRDTAQGADYFIYEPDVYSYVVYDLKNLEASVKRRKITTVRKESAGIIESTLWNAMVDNGLSIGLIDRMEGIFQWSLDFHHIQAGDRFKVIYDEELIDGKPVGIGKIHGGYFKNYDNEYYGIYHENGKFKGYYDENAAPMKSPFLKAPIKFSQFRISSSYNLRRFHPVLKRTRPHYGTDYAAAYGTPIVAVANGVVTHAAYGKGNGRYVKIKHDKVYQTQYLHMQKFGKGIRSGVHVKQGQVIGYVGSTGLATGPHVCFRFWKNGKQVNHRRLKLPNPEPMPEAEKPLFYPVRDNIVQLLNAIPFPEVAPKEEEIEAGEEISELIR